LVSPVSGPEERKTADWEHADDAKCVRASRRGELAAFDTLVGRYQRRATAVAYRLLNNRDDALEITQDAFLNAYQKLDSLHDPKRFGSWLLRIVSNLSLNRRRSRALRRGASLEAWRLDEDAHADLNAPPSREPGPAQRASAKDLQTQIAAALDELPDMQRQALILFSIEKMPQKEVAEILGCSVQAVKWHVFAARKKLKDKLSDYL